MTEPERVVYESMKTSPYRSYLDGEVLSDAEVVYLKVIADDAAANEIVTSLHKALPERPFRIVRRAQEQREGLSGIYIYDHAAEPGHAKSVLMQKYYPGLKHEDVALKGGYRNEYDALHLLGKIENRYEPIRFF